ncbi:hypothetical protein [Streptomyces sp. NPDC093600]|uniref:hypothetical protein n=1 Tax=Streptomyces sp. NPDC093600 TaxID=3366047 RepID=UPI0037F905EC
MNQLLRLLKRTWIDWAVFVSMVVAVARCKSPFLDVFFTVGALAAAAVGIRKTWQMVGRDPRRSAP